MNSLRTSRLARLGAIILWSFWLAGFLQAQTLTPGQPLDPLSLSWPRFFSTNGLEFAVYQPQIAQWPGNQIQGRFAIAVRPAGTSNETYGIVFFNARTEIDKVNRLVTLEDFKVSKVNFPTQRSQQGQYQAIIQSELPQATKTIPLDHLESVFVVSAEVEKAKVQPVLNTPPRIIYTTQPSLLVLVDGTPVFQPLILNYERVANTRAVLLQNTNSVDQGYYLHAAGNWYSAPSLEGPWQVDLTPPADAPAALAAALATGQVEDAAPQNPLATPLHIFVSTTPAELLQSNGMANLLSLPGTDLLYVANSDNAIFYNLDDANYYVLISGRWFSSSGLYGTWSYVPPDQLPAQFKQIPPEGPKSNVLASIPGTPMAQEAVIANSIPQTATINRSQAQLTVNYAGGSPGFAPVQGTSLQYATNTPTAVLEVNPTTYYACQSGVWFTASTAQGPWVAATSVPSVIYTIPVSNPLHYVTYVYVYGSTPQFVYVGYTPGYAGTVVAPSGVVVYGTGYYYPPVVVGATYVSYPPTYGYGASLAVGAAVGFAFGYAAGASSACWYEPHWGCYSYGAYSYSHVNVNSANFYTSWGTAVHATGAYGYNAYTGTSWGAQHASTYNPYTGTSGNLNRGAAYNPYTGTGAAGKSGSWYNPNSGATAAARSGATGNAYTGNYAAGKQAAGYNPSTGVYGAAEKGVTGNAYTGQSSSVDRGVVGNANTGNKVAWNNGNIYTDKNGNINRYSPTGSGYQSYSSSGWQNKSASASSSSWSDRGWDSSNWNRSSGSYNDMNRESWGQSTGSQRFSSWGRSGGGGWGGFRGGGGGGFRR
ncbi:MAG: carbohydrate-binding family V/XII [Verrucomicrobia bacterium]|nr:carbohydrate-binding family V/XII [Verrucomicrobiota bacterium]